MKIIRKIKKKNPSYFIVSICTIVLTLFTSFGYKKVLSDTVELVSTVEIEIPITFAQEKNLVFGTIQPPSSGSVDVLLKRDTDDIIDSCPTDAVCFDTAQRGQVRAEGSPGSTFYMTYGNGFLSNGSGSTIAVDLSHSSINNYSSSTFLDPEGYKYRSFGGILTISSTLPHGEYDTNKTGATPPTITINY